jgi:uncharacterized membrane protein YjjP (DUF1212 family)
MIDFFRLALGLAFMSGFLGGEMVCMLSDGEFYMAGWACICGIVMIAMSRMIAGKIGFDYRC